MPLKFVLYTSTPTEGMLTFLRLTYGRVPRKCRVSTSNHLVFRVFGRRTDARAGQQRDIISWNHFFSVISGGLKMEILGGVQIWCHCGVRAENPI